MATAECNYFNSGGGGSVTLNQLLYNANKTLLDTITTVSGSYTATEDCVMYGSMAFGGSSSSPNISFDSTVFAFLNTGGTLYFGYSSSSLSTPDTYGVFVPKGTVVTTRNVGTYNLKFYTLD